MTSVLDPAIATAADAHHEVLRRDLVRLSQVLIAAVRDGIPFEPSRRRLADFLRRDLLPHLDAEEILLLRTADQGPVALLAGAMQDEHRVLTALIREVEAADTPMDAVVAASALVVLFDLRVRHESRHVLPALAGSGVDMRVLLEDTPAIIGETAGSHA